MTDAQLSGDKTRSRPRVLCVDDEPLVLEGLRDVLGRSFEVSVAGSGSDGLAILRAEPDAFAIVISDMRMPVMSGADFLRSARTIAPDAVRMLLTGHADLQAAIRAVNGARLFRFLTKPCETQELLGACVAALGQHRLQTAERVLLEETLRGSVDALAEVLALANPAAFGRGGRVKELAGRLARAAELRNRWEIEVAAMLADIGAVTLPQATAEKVYAGARLTPSEAAMVARVPAVTRQLLSKIPRLEGVLEILDAARPAGDPSGAPIGARVLRIAVDYVELESQGASGTVAVGAMRSRERYDRQLLDTLAGVIGAEAAVVRELVVAELRVGMTLADDARSVRGELLLARGQRVTERLVERIRNIGAEGVREPLRAFDPETASR
ncbi:MAG TPA: HD domain-containing phosphohydrolase [Solirubrobacteraceae bacterium]|nr:HD domain-containing phosphohydrolase [Solirubrobacteraceae bacterium]